MKNFFLCITGLLISFSGWCKVRVPAIFSDHSVFQQGGGNPIWGWAKPGEEVTVSTSWGDERFRNCGQERKVDGDCIYFQSGYWSRSYDSGR